MTLALYAHPFSSYSQKALIALYEHKVPFEFRLIGPENPAYFAELTAFWPFGKFPVLADGDNATIEASIIIEYLDLHYRGPAKLLPDDPEKALEARFMDRFFDNYVHTPMQKIVADALRNPAECDPKGVADAKAMLETSYRWLDQRMNGRIWAVGDNFSLADCSAAPSLFYADWAHRIDGAFKNVSAYRQRLNARPSFARAVDEARPYRHYFPLGAPDRD